MRILGRNLPGSKDGRCKGPEAGTCMQCRRDKVRAVWLE